MTPESLRAQLDAEAIEILRLQADKERALAEYKKEVENNFSKLIADHADEEIAKFNAISQQLDELKAQIRAIQTMFEQGKTALWVIKWLGYLAAGSWAFLVWGKDHLKL